MATGKLIAFEGIDGSGITTQADMLKRWFVKHGRMVFLTKEPTNGPAGAVIQLVLSKRLLAAKNRMSSSRERTEGLHPATIALLFAADRIDHLTGDVQPMLEKGVTVITDRYWLSSFAYQTVDLDLEWVRAINSKAIRPDLSIYFDIPIEPAQMRRDQARWHQELFEDETLRLVRQNYLSCIKAMRAEGHRIVDLDATEPLDVVHRKVLKAVKGLYSPTPTNSVGETQLELINKAELTQEG